MPYHQLLDEMQIHLVESLRSDLTWRKSFSPADIHALILIVDKITPVKIREESPLHEEYNRRYTTSNANSRLIEFDNTIKTFRTRKRIRLSNWLLDCAEFLSGLDKHPLCPPQRADLLRRAWHNLPRVLAVLSGEQRQAAMDFLAEMR